MNEAIEKLVLDKIRQRYSNDQQAGEVSSATLLRDLQMDSLSILELVYELEEHYSLLVDDQVLLELKSVADIVLMIEQAQKH